MSDIVERLRSHANWYISCALGNVPEEANDELEAADEIARLRSELAKARNAALERCAEILDDAGETLVDEWTSDLGWTDQTRAAGIASHRVADAAAAIRALKAEGESR